MENSCSPAPWYSALTREDGGWSDLWDERLYHVVVANSCEIFETPANHALDSANADFIADARERLPKYRQALEAVLGHSGIYYAGNEPTDPVSRAYTKGYNDAVGHIREAIQKAMEA